jgi:hypothetical protein
VVLTSTQTAPAPVPTEKFAGLLVEQAVLAVTAVVPPVVTLAKVIVAGGTPGLEGRLGVTPVPTGVLPVPVPVRPTVCVLPATPLLLSVKVRVPVSEPVAVGEKVTLIVQEPPDATGLLVEQVVPGEATAKELALAPVMAMLLRVRGAVPVALLKVTAWPALVVPMD